MYELGGGSSSSVSSVGFASSRVATLATNPWLVEEPIPGHLTPCRHTAKKDAPDIATTGSSG